MDKIHIIVTAENESEKIGGDVTKKRIEKALDLLKDNLRSDSLDFALIENIILILSREEYMSATRASDILEDAKNVVPLISELKLL